MIDMLVTLESVLFGYFIANWIWMPDAVWNRPDMIIVNVILFAVGGFLLLRHLGKRV